MVEKVKQTLGKKISQTLGNKDKEEIVKSLQEALSPEMIKRKERLYLRMFPRDSLDEVNGQYIIDKFIQEYKTLREYMIYDDIRNNNPKLFRTLGFNDEGEFLHRYESQKKEIKYMIDMIQPYVKEDLSFFDTLVEKDKIFGIKDLYDIETVRERLINIDILTDEQKTVILGYITLKKSDFLG